MIRIAVRRLPVVALMCAFHTSTALGFVFSGNTSVSSRGFSIPFEVEVFSERLLLRGTQVYAEPDTVVLGRGTEGAEVPYGLIDGRFAFGIFIRRYTDDSNERLFFDIDREYVDDLGSSWNVRVRFEVYGDLIPDGETHSFENVRSGAWDVSGVEVSLNGGNGIPGVSYNEWETETLDLTSLYFGEFVAPPGDYDANGVVNEEDYDAWVATYGSVNVEAGQGADGNGDGVVDAADYVVWRDAFENAVAVTSIPEPTALFTLAMSAAMTSAVARRRV